MEIEIQGEVYKLVGEKREDFEKSVKEVGIPVTDSVEESLYRARKIIETADLSIKPEELYDAWNNAIKKRMREYALRSAVAAILSNSGSATGTAEEKIYVKRKIDEYLK